MAYPQKSLNRSGDNFRSQNILYVLGMIGGAWMRDPNTVAAIVNVLRQVHGDTARG